jgi:lysophospholipase L1-like esterase
MGEMTEADGSFASVASFAALGDSFTEGLDDPRSGGGYRGWADRFASHLAASTPGLRYANLAVRGKLLGEVISGQLPAAIDLAPELVSIAAGGNDLLRPGADPDLLAEVFDAGVVSLTAAGCRVLVFTGFDPNTFPVIRWIRGRVAVYNMHLRAIADRRGCLLVDLWSMPVLRDPRVWSQDRLHLNGEGHRRVALRACEVVGIPVSEDWRETLPPGGLRGAGGLWGAGGSLGAWGVVGAGQPRGAGGLRGAGGALGAGQPLARWVAARRLDVRWARRYAMPWVRRRIRGVSTGDGLLPKRPVLSAFDDPELSVADR